MKILLIRQFNPYIETGASANRFRGLVDGLCREGQHVTIAVVGGQQKKDEASLFKSPNERLRVEYLSRSNHYGYLMSRLNNYLFDNTTNLLKTRKRLQRILQKPYDIVWLTNNATVFKLYYKGRNRCSLPTFIELNEFNDRENATNNFFQKRKVEKDNSLFLEIIGKIDLFGVMTKTLIAHYQSMAKPEARFIHLPMTVDLSRFEFILNTDAYQKPYIGYTGTMSNQKDGVDVLINAFAKIADKYPSLHLYLAGFWHNDVLMQNELITGFGLNERIHRIGVLNREQIPTFIGNASLLVLSRPDSHQAQGGFPTKLGEYLATGNPVCVTKVGEIPDYLEDNVSAFMAEPGDVNSFADAMDRALRNADNAKQIGVKGRKVAEQWFNADLQAKRLIEFLEKFLQCQSNKL